MKRVSKFWQFSLVVVAVLSFVVLSSGRFLGEGLPGLSSSPAAAQVPSTSQVWRQIYQQFPSLPLENQYTNLKTGQVDPNNTLITRLIRYHTVVKSRPPIYRLDWKLTFADYLGVNEVMEEATYPNADILRPNPLDGDREALSKLSRTEREALIQALVDAYLGRSAANPTPAPASPSPSPKPSPQPSQPAPRLPAQPKPGDARLLMP